MADATTRLPGDFSLEDIPGGVPGPTDAGLPPGYEEANAARLDTSVDVREPPRPGAPPPANLPPGYEEVPAAALPPGYEEVLSDEAPRLALPGLGMSEARTRTHEKRRGYDFFAEDKARLHSLLQQSLETNGGEEAHVLNLSKLSQVPSDVIAANVKGFEKSWVAANFDADKWLGDVRNLPLWNTIKEHPEAGHRWLIPSSQMTGPVGPKEESTAKKFLVAAGKMFDAAMEMGTPDFSILDLPERVTQLAGALEAAEKAKAGPPPTPEQQQKSQQEARAFFDAMVESYWPTPPTVPLRPDPTAAVADWTGLYKKPWAAGVNSAKQLDLHRLGFRLAMEGEGPHNYELQRRVQDLQMEVGANFYNAGPVESFIIGGVETFGSEAPSLAAAGAGYVATKALAAGANRFVPGSGAFVRKTVGPILTGGLVFGASFVTEFGGDYLDMREVKLDDGRPLPLDVARAAAGASAFVKAAIETGTQGPFLGLFGPYGDAIRRHEGRAFIKEMARKFPTRMALLADIGKRMASGVSVETLEEMAQETVAILSGYVAKGVAQGGIPTAHIAEAVEQIALTGEKTALGTAAVGLVGAAPRIARGMRTLSAERVGGRQVQAVNGIAETDEAKQVPQLVATLAKEEAKQSGHAVESLHMHAKEFVRYYQEAGADPFAAADGMFGEGGAQKLNDAIAEGEDGKVEIPLATYFEKWSGTEASRALAGDTTAHPLHKTPRQRQAQRQQIEAEAARLEKEEVPPESEAEARLVDTVVEQLKQTGKYTEAKAKRAVALRRAFIRTMAADFGVSPDDLFRDYVTRVSAATGVAPAGALEQRAFHGGPHDFEGPFSMQMIGTGEGAQAYGHGLYFAEIRDVAERYRSARGGGAVAVDGRTNIPYEGRQAALRLLERIEAGTDFETAKAQQIEEERGQVAWIREQGADPTEREDAVKLLEALTPDRLQRTQGQVFQADVPESHELLDYDSGQPKEVIAKLRSSGLAEEVLGELERAHAEFSPRPMSAARKSLENIPGRAIYEALEKTRGSAQAASETLRKAGIPGLRYLDQGSRGAGKGTHNFVVWDDSRITVEKKFYQDDEKLKRALKANEDSIRLEPIEHGVALTEDGKFLFKHDSKDPRRIEFTPEQMEVLRNAVTAILTHNHPSGLTFSPKDVMVAIAGNVKEMRVVTRDGTAWRLLRPASGRWLAEGVDAESLRSELRAAVVASKKKADDAKLDAQTARLETGTGTEKTNGPESEDDVYRRVLSDEVVRAFNAIGERRGGWRVERDAGVSPQGGGRSGGDGRRRDGGHAGGGPEKASRVGKDESDARGWTTFVQRGVERLTDIVLTPKANMSTFLHEEGHVFLEWMGDLAERPDAPQRLKDNYAAALKWMGVESRADIKTEHHEKWARAFEAYLLRGEAPSSALFAAFETFRKWLGDVYRQARGLGVNVPEDVAKVFDRMLATDAEIARMEGAMGLQSIARTPEEAGMSPEDWQAHLAAREEGTSRAASRLRKRVLERALKETTREWKAALKQALAAARDEYETLPAAKVLKHLKDGGTDARLDREVVKRMFKDDPRLALLEPYLDVDGHHPDSVAEGFDYATGRSMLEALLSLQPKEEWAQTRAEEAMLQQHPDILLRGQQLEAEAGRALQAESRNTLLAELNAFRKKAGGTPEGASPIESIEKAAAAMVERRTVQRLDAGTALRQQASFADKALRAAAKGNFAQAYVYKQQQLLHFFLWRELMQAREEREGLEETAAALSKATARAKLGKASPVYLDGVDSILEGLGLAPVRQRETQLRSLDSVTSAMKQNAHTVMFDAELIGGLLGRKAWKELTVAEMREVARALENIRKAASNLSTVLREGKRVAKDEGVAQLIDEAARFEPEVGAVSSSIPGMSLVQAGLTAWSYFSGEQLRVETMVRWLGGKNVESAWHQLIVAPLQQASTREKLLLEETVAPLVKAFTDIPRVVRSRMREKIDGAALFPNHREDMLPPAYRFEILMMALNRGTESNLRRLTEGRNITVQQVDKALEMLTREEWAWVQTVWAQSESIWPLSRDLEERDSGVAPPKVVGVAVPTKYGVIQGNYFPLVADPRMDEAGSKQASDQTLAGLMDVSFTRPGTSHGHLISRQENAKYAVALDPSAVLAGLAKAVHDIAFREPVKSVGSLIIDKRIQATLKRHLREGRAAPFLQYVKDLGQLRGAEVVSHARFMQRALSIGKGNTTQSVMSYNWRVAIGNVANLFMAPVATELKVAPFLAAVGESLVPGMAGRQKALAYEKSDMLRAATEEDTQKLRRDLALMSSRIPIVRKSMGQVVRFGYAFSEAVDRYVSVPVWMASYRQALKEGRSDGAAVEFADSIVRRTSSAKSAVDKSELMRNRSGVGMILMLFGYFNTSYNLRADIWHDAYLAFFADELPGGPSKAKALGKLAAYEVPRLLARLFVYSAVYTLGDALTRGGPDDGEDGWEYLRRKLMWNAAGIGDTPFVGGIAEPLFTGKPANQRGQPGLESAQKLGKAVVKLGNSAIEGDVSAEEWFDLAKALAPLTGAPLPLLKMGDYVLKVSEGEETPDDAVDFTHRLLYRPQLPRGSRQ